MRAGTLHKKRTENSNWVGNYGFITPPHTRPSCRAGSLATDQSLQIGRWKMWQPDIKFETATYPAGGVAPSTFTLALFNYIQKVRAKP